MQALQTSVVRSLERGRTIAGETHDRTLQDRLDQATGAGSGRSLRGALGKAQDEAIEQRVQEERQRILHELQLQFEERLKVLEERERAVSELEDADGREGLAEQAATTVQLREAVERQELRIEELMRNVESERYRREVAERVLEDPSLVHQLSVEIELLELRARLENVVDREFADLRESELKAEIDRLGAQLAVAGGDALELALAVGQLGPEPLDLDAELVHELRILEHALRDLAPVALALHVAQELLDARFLLLHGLAQVHGRGSLLGQPVAAVLVLERGNDALALLEYLQPLLELELQLVQDALALLLDALLDGLVLSPAERSAQAPARPGSCGLVEAVLESAVMGFVCDGASLARGFLSTDVCGA